MSGGGISMSGGGIEIPGFPGQRFRITELRMAGVRGHLNPKAIWFSEMEGWGFQANRGRLYAGVELALTRVAAGDGQRGHPTTRLLSPSDSNRGSG